MWAIILDFDWATHASIIQNENYQQSLEKMKKNGELERQYKHFSLFSSFTIAIDLNIEARANLWLNYQFSRGKVYIIM